ncbi:MAG: hypothetical protein IJ228_10660 [Succinivibrio sp.]|nr:hypothetical protein [Succinivibrio sp.]
MDSTFARQLMQPPRLLLRRLLAYNGCGRMPQDRYQDLAGTALLQSLQTRPDLCASLTLPGSAWYDFAQPHNRMVLLSEEVVERWARYLGACFWAPQLIRLIERSEIFAVREAIGEECRHFALGRGRLIMSQKLRACLVDPDAQVEPREIPITGYTVLRTLSELATSGYRREFPLTVRPMLQEFSKEQQGVLWDLAVKVLCQEVDSSCLDIFS